MPSRGHRGRDLAPQRSGERGSAAVEAGLILPVFAMCFFFLLWLGYLQLQALRVTTTARHVAWHVAASGVRPDEAGLRALVGGNDMQVDSHRTRDRGLLPSWFTGNRDGAVRADVSVGNPSMFPDLFDDVELRRRFTVSTGFGEARRGREGVRTILGSLAATLGVGG